MKTRLLSLLVALFATTALWAYDFKSGDLYYTIITNADNHEVAVAGSNDSAGLTLVTIPSTITYGDDTYSVTRIGGHAFYGCTGLTSITIPNSVTSIGWYAFYGCTGLTSITIPESVTSIEYSAFHNTLWYNNQPDGMIYINNMLYKYKGTMPQGTSITIADGTTGISDYAFDGCPGLVSITIPNSVMSIGSYTFKGCTGLTSVTIPESVTSIGRYAFFECTGLKKINYIGDVLGWLSIIDEDNNPIQYSKNLYLNDVLLTDLVIPDGVTEISSAFANDTCITSVTIPESVTSIGSSAFSGCTGLTSVTIPESVTSIGRYAFSDCIGLTSITIPNSVTSIEDYAFLGCIGLTSVTISNSVTSIGVGTFYDCTGLTSVTIPESVTSIGRYAFSDCIGLTSITIPNSVTSIDDYAFSGCIGLTSVTISNSVTSIGDGTFYDCTGLTSVTIPESVTSIEFSAFYGCTSLTSITIPESVTSIRYSAFYGCTGISSIIWNAKDCHFKGAPIVVGNAQTSNNSASSNKSPFEDSASQITSITFGENVENIPAYLCYNMIHLPSVPIPNKVTSIGSSAFSGCSGLTSITIPNKVTSIGSSAFSGCTGLTSITIGNSVESIGVEAFYGCEYLEEVSIGAGVKEIGEKAFANDKRIYSVTCYASVTPTIDSTTFSGVSSNTELYVLANSVKKYKVDEYWSKFTIVPIDVETTKHGTLSIVPSATEAVFTWPADDNAETYTLVIKKDDVVFCTLCFNGDGQLTNIAFAPSRDGTKHQPAAESTTGGYRFTVTGLSAASHYVYQIEVKDVAENVLNTYEGEFNTTGYVATDVDEVVDSTENMQVSKKIYRDGQVYILRGDRTYTITGDEVR